jgi:hypothetical protein
MEKLLIIVFKDLYMSWAKKMIAMPQAAHQVLGKCFHVGFLRFTLPICDYSRSPSTWDLKFSSASQLGTSTRKWGSTFMLGEVEQG